MVILAYMDWTCDYILKAYTRLIIINLFNSVDGKEIKMTEDHKITSYSERLRIEEMGEPLKDGETRLYGININSNVFSEFQYGLGNC